MLPTFLGIGAPKAGTTWLYELLDSHPDVLMSRYRKEVHYFDRHYDRGADWYEGYFPSGAGPAPAAVGEFTTHYLYNSAVPARVASISTIGRFLLIVRNPVDRVFSHYRFRLRQDNDTSSFEEFLERQPDAISLGCYGRHLVPWFAEFEPRQFLVLVFETAVRGPHSTQREVARHLGIDPTRFPRAVPRAANEAFVPRHRRLYTAGVRQARWLRRHDLDRLITVAKRAGLAGLLKSRRTAETGGKVPQELRRRLWDRFEDDVALLEDLTGLDLGHWRPDSP